ncbi:conserved protein of unknown function [Nitrosotalea devaniterrae]|uniref:Uncharacterized protein n=1 Tax=Nitrosotalea devaniterrae TaxID=1078905 RepID=A0A128A3F3_9ARCH|nr:conserved protein of unknown function [Candidatus Nitrosotalea devanaterra]
MQIPTSNPDPFIKSMSDKAESIRSLFLEHITTLTNKVPLKVMLGDGTVTDQESFDPARVRQFFDDLLKKTPEWENQGVTATAEKDLRRSFIKFEIKEGNYLLSAHMSLQYHALLFYKLDHRVIEIQKELADISDMITKLQVQVGPENDKIIQEKLQKEGYQGMDEQKLFEVLFNREDITQDIVKSIEVSHAEHTKLVANRDRLFGELDNMLIEVYHTTPVLIDENKMIAAEEGCLCNFNLEYLKKNTRQGNINLTRISAQTKTNLLVLLDSIIKILKN